MLTQPTPHDIRWTYSWSWTLYDFLSYPMLRVQALQHFPQLVPSPKSIVWESDLPFPMNILHSSPLTLPLKNPSFLRFVPDSYLALYTIYVNQGTTGLYTGFLVHLFHSLLNDSLKYFLLTTYFTKLDFYIQRIFQWKRQHYLFGFKWLSAVNNKTLPLSPYVTLFPSYLTPLRCDPLQNIVYLPSTSFCQTSSQIALKLLADFLCYPILSLQTKLLISEPLTSNSTDPFSFGFTVYKQHGLGDGFYKGVLCYLTVKFVEYTSEWMFYRVCIPRQRNQRLATIQTNHFSSLACALTSPLTALSFEQRTKCVLPDLIQTPFLKVQTTTWPTYVTNVFFATLVACLYCKQIS